ncbi:hypothetical protein F5B22DRAFT_157082 [Xylaria bambusicola]|uniref:uncharacterized protein n=1 Tax=Xylaria bambusicola TaxID=326684 RepID=UPI002008DCEB|nr:uncharacterized protein F5B22DRAFT_157082 [Xylaria bambusicola]KAI0526418.1 hypothetical protein F5B22DRAFT_157082 [Xylaria bambusicola]
MILSPRHTPKSRYLAPGSSPAITGRRYRNGLKAEQQLKPLPYIRKGSQLRPKHITCRRKTHIVRIGWDGDEREDGRRLASDPTVMLSGEGQRRTPRLERQEAFRAPHNWEDDAIDDVALYRLGILYDDGDSNNPHVRGSGFCLDAIVHTEPTYSIRPAKRARKTHIPQLKEEDLHLSVNLLSTYLTEDSAVAHFLESIRDEVPVWLHRGEYEVPRVSAVPLSMIEELVESATHSRGPAAASDFPELVSDVEEDEVDEESEEGDDWALVSDPRANAVSMVTDIDVAIDDRELVSPVDGAWVFIAGDDSEQVRL